MPSPFDIIMEGAAGLPDPPTLAMPDRQSLGLDVLRQGGSNPEQRFQRSAYQPIAGRPVRTQFENDLFTFDIAGITGDLSKFDDGEDEEEADPYVCGRTKQPPGYPVLMAQGMARVTGNSSLGANRWSYQCQRVVPPLSGTPSGSGMYVADATLDQTCDPTTFTAWNMNEFDNDGEGIEGPGMDTESESYLNCDLEMKPLTQGVYPYWRYMLASGAFIHVIYGANDHSPA